MTTPDPQPPLSWDELEQLADYGAGLLAGPDADRIDHLIDTDPRWAAAHTTLQNTEATITADANDGTRLAAVSVADTGPGIPAEQQRLLFREFHRLDSAAGTEGAGIGLAISRRLARALGGDLTIESEVGKGSTFTLSLPA